MVSVLYGDRLVYIVWKLNSCCVREFFRYCLILGVSCWKVLMVVSCVRFGVSRLSGLLMLWLMKLFIL